MRGTNEIAMLELGAYQHQKLYNSAKNRVVRAARGILLGLQQCQGSECAAEYVPDLPDAGTMPFVPASRDIR